MLTWLLRVAVQPLLFAALLAPACGPSRERVEAERILVLLDKLRMAEHEARGPLLAEIEKDHATGEAAERARSSCAAAFRALHDAQAAIAEVEKSVDDSKKAGTVPDAALLGKLDDAQRRLGEANAQMPTCSQTVAALKMKFP